MNLEKEIKEAKIGSHIWEEIKNQFEIDDEDIIVCFPTNNNELNLEAQKQLEEYMKAKFLKRLFVFVIEQNEVSQSCIKENITIINMTEEEMNCFIKFIKLVDFSGQIIVISDESPFGNLNIVRGKEISLKTYIAGSYLWRPNVTNE